MEAILNLINSGISVYHRLDKLSDDKKNASFLQEYLLKELKSEVEINIDYLQNLRIETFADFRKCKKDACSVCNQLTLNCLTNLKRSENFALLRNFDSKIKKVCESNNLQKKYVSDEIRSILEKIESLKKNSNCEVNVER